MRAPPGRISGVMAGLAVALAAMAPAPAGATFAGSNGRIAYSRGTAGVYTIKPDGTERVRVTWAEDYEAAWSPSGQQLALCRFIPTPGAGFGYDPAVFVVAADGSSEVRVSGPMNGLCQPPRWAPDGTALAYSDYDDFGDPIVGSLRIAQPDGGGEALLGGYDDLNLGPTWSPNGSELAIARIAGGDPEGPGESELYVVAADGSGNRQLTDSREYDESPEWSPDGKRLLFVRDTLTSTGVREAIWKVSRDGSNARRLARGGYAAWSPDGRRIVFVADGDLFVMERDGSHVRRLTQTSAPEGGVDWQARP